MRWPRFSTGGLMAATFLVALALGFGRPALGPLRHQDLHLHEWGLLENGKATFVGGGMRSPPFWPRYWDRFLGRDGERSNACQGDQGPFVEACERNHPPRQGECYVETLLFTMEVARIVSRSR